jgi:hypothetical protein
MPRQGSSLAVALRLDWRFLSLIRVSRECEQALAASLVHKDEFFKECHVLLVF